jgi:hypothetical protein
VRLFIVLTASNPMGHILPPLRSLHPLALFPHGVLWPADENASV